jgi:hypothetical protein
MALLGEFFGVGIKIVWFKMVLRKIIVQREKYF